MVTTNYSSNKPKTFLLLVFVVSILLLLFALPKIDLSFSHGASKHGLSVNEKIIRCTENNPNQLFYKLNNGNIAMPCFDDELGWTVRIVFKDKNGIHEITTYPKEGIKTWGEMEKYLLKYGTRINKPW
jgi:hypothetical protein